jgi:hypothetical protein
VAVLVEIQQVQELLAQLIQAAGVAVLAAMR